MSHMQSLVSRHFFAYKHPLNVFGASPQPNPTASSAVSGNADTGRFDCKDFTTAQRKKPVESLPIHAEAARQHWLRKLDVQYIPGELHLRIYLPSNKSIQSFSVIFLYETVFIAYSVEKAVFGEFSHHQDYTAIYHIIPYFSIVKDYD